MGEMEMENGERKNVTLVVSIERARRALTKIGVDMDDLLEKGEEKGARVALRLSDVKEVMKDLQGDKSVKEEDDEDAMKKVLVVRRKHPKSFFSILRHKLHKHIGL